MKIVVVGTGYVGLVSGTCFAEMGNSVTCVDIDQKKIDGLKQGIIPIFEPGLEELVLSNVKAGRLHFTTSLKDALKDCKVIFIAVGTPTSDDGSADMQYVYGVAAEIGQHLDHYAVVVSKSTVPVGTSEKVKSIVSQELAKRKSDINFDVASNPEFLKEGAAIKDFMNPDRIVIGTESEQARLLLQELYAPFHREHDVTLYMGIRESEMSKYAANAMLATKISFINEIARLCDGLGVDVESVRIGIGSDKRIGYHFINPGPGYGGSCFPKDVKALIQLAKQNDIDAIVLQSVDDRNEEQKKRLFQKMSAFYGEALSGKVIAIWGLAFKPETDDMREAPALTLIHALIKAGASVRAHDPISMNVTRRSLPAEWVEEGKITFFDDQYDALEGADAMALVTEWKPFCNPDFDKIKNLLRAPVIFDGRNQYSPQSMAEYGFKYFGIGRGLSGE
ncbi:MAG: UDP-glucose/GDP-mannose dehydrogenase family protein [Pseudomonadales bacterium]|nr:UDP-glucose/GDP-mannose dehydrogenase family protein [Pseudomonadales bacterium]